MGREIEIRMTVRIPSHWGKYKSVNVPISTRNGNLGEGRLCITGETCKNDL